MRRRIDGAVYCAADSAKQATASATEQAAATRTSTAPTADWHRLALYHISVRSDCLLNHTDEIGLQRDDCSVLFHTVERQGQIGIARAFSLALSVHDMPNQSR